MANVGSPVSRHVNERALGNFPSGSVQCFEVIRNLFDVLDGTVRTDDAVFHVFIPQAKLREVAQQMFIDDDEFTREHAAGIDV